MNLIETEKQTYEDVWSLSEYAEVSPGKEVIPFFLDMAGITEDNRDPGTILDAGCGSGKSSIALAARGFKPTLFDITDARVPEVREPYNFHQGCLWHDLEDVGTHDFVYCTDVLEHIPTQFTLLAIDQMLRVTWEGLFISVCLIPDNFGMWVGKPLHQTVQPYLWWKESISAVGDLVESRDLLQDAVFYVRPKFL